MYWTYPAYLQYNLIIDGTYTYTYNTHKIIDWTYPV